jgi:GntR family transcriptional regulator
MNSTIVERDIMYALDPASGVPFYRQIIQRIEHAILARKLLPGDRLPTIRALAIELKINPNTIAKAYGELELRGIVVTQVGSGTYVSDKRVEPDDGELSRKLAEKVARFVNEMAALGSSREEAADLVRDFKEDHHVV